MAADVDAVTLRLDGPGNAPDIGRVGLPDHQIKATGAHQFPSRRQSGRPGTHDDNRFGARHK